MERDRPQNQETRLVRERNIVSIYKPEGTYTIIYGGFHFITAYNPKELPGNIDGVFLEGSDLWMPDYRKVRPRIEKERIPIYYSDLIPRFPWWYPLETAGFVLEIPWPFLKPLVRSESLFDLLNLTIRNNIIAYKEEWLMKRLGNKPHMVTLIARGHRRGIEECILKTPEEKLSTLKNLRLLMKLAFKSNTIWDMLKANFTGRRWECAEVFEVPELKEL